MRKSFLFEFGQDEGIDRILRPGWVLRFGHSRPLRLPEKPPRRVLTSSSPRGDSEQNDGCDKFGKGWSHGRLRVRGRRAGFPATVLRSDGKGNGVGGVVQVKPNRH